MLKKSERSKTQIVQGQIFKTIAFTFLVFGAVTMLVPFIWSLLTSLKSAENIFAHNAFWIQFPPDFSAYKAIWNRIPILSYAGNTLKVALIVTVGQLATSSLAGFAFARLRFPGRNKLFFIYIAHHDGAWYGAIDPEFCGDEMAWGDQYSLGVDPFSCGRVLSEHF